MDRTRFTSPRHVIDVWPPRSSQTRERHTSFHSLHTDDEIGSIASIHRRPVESHFRSVIDTQAIVSPVHDMASKSNVARRHVMHGAPAPVLQTCRSRTGARLTVPNRRPVPDLLPHKAVAYRCLHRLRVTLCGIGSLPVELEVGAEPVNRRDDACCRDCWGGARLWSSQTSEWTCIGGTSWLWHRVRLA